MLANGYTLYMCMYMCTTTLFLILNILGYRKYGMMCTVRIKPSMMCVHDVQTETIRPDSNMYFSKLHIK